MERSSIRVTTMFRDQCEITLGIRASEAIEALCEPDSIERLPGVQSNLILGVRAKGGGRALLALANEVGGVHELLAAFRVKTFPNSDKSPLTLLNNLLAACGLLVRAGDREDLFLQHVNVVVEPGQPLLQGPAADGLGMVFMVLRLNEGSPRTADMFWVFSISVNRYRAYAQTRP